MHAWTRPHREPKTSFWSPSTPTATADLQGGAQGLLSARQRFTLWRRRFELNAGLPSVDMAPDRSPGDLATRLHRIAFIGNQLPRRRHRDPPTIASSRSTARPRLETSVAAMTNPDQTYAIRALPRSAMSDRRLCRCRRITCARRRGEPSARAWIFGGEAGGISSISRASTCPSSRSHRAHKPLWRSAK